MNRREIYTSMLVILCLISFPFLFALLAGGKDYVFAGFLYNPVDGATYLAKVRQGWVGAWRFTLPYTVNGGQGAFVYLYYLFLGHLARWLNLPLLPLYHLARLAGAGMLICAVAVFSNRMFGQNRGLVRAAFWLTLCGAGMGWLELFGGRIPFDFWVAEAYPFLSMLTNPHFPTGLALIVFSLVFFLEEISLRRLVKLAAAGLALSLIFPFGMVIALGLSGGWLVWTWLETRRLDWQPAIGLGVGGGPYLLYQFVALQADPVLSVWNAQNVNLSPPLWDLVISLSPALILAVLALYWQIRLKKRMIPKLLILWLGLGFLLAYLPTTIQRRFTLGLYIPIAGLAVYGFDLVCQQKPKWAKLTGYLLFICSALTSLFLLFSAFIATYTHPLALYMHSGEARAMDWIQNQLPTDAVVLASPDIGLWIPAFTGRRVVYGHPFETMNADVEKTAVLSFYESRGWSAAQEDFLNSRQVGYVFYGPREKALGGQVDFSHLKLEYDSGDVQIYSRSQ